MKLRKLSLTLLLTVTLLLAGCQSGNNTGNTGTADDAGTANNAAGGTEEDSGGTADMQVEEGRQQLLRRAAWVESHYDAFRRFVHQVRQEAEAGKRPYGAFPGPRLPLQVDPEKDIKLHLVLIGGRTTQDLADSQARHREDQSSRFSLETETWDSWLNKLTRP